MIKLSEFKEIMRNQPIHKLDKCHVLVGLEIVNKYLPGKGLESSEHDIVYSADISDLIKSGITKIDVGLLRSYGWFIDEDWNCLATFV